MFQINPHEYRFFSSVIVVRPTGTLLKILLVILQCCYACAGCNGQLCPTDDIIQLSGVPRWIQWSPTKAEDIEMMETTCQSGFKQDCFPQCSLISLPTLIKMEDTSLSTRAVGFNCVFWELWENEQFLLKLKAGSISDMTVTIATNNTLTTLKMKWQTHVQIFIWS